MNSSLPASPTSSAGRRTSASHCPMTANTVTPWPPTSTTAAWWHYSFARTGGLELHDIDLWEIPANRSTPGNIVLTSMPDRRDRNLFPNVYTDPKAGTDTGTQPQFPKATGPISYIGHDQVNRDIANLKAGLAAAGYDERAGYINALSPGSASRIANEYYQR